MAAFQYFSVSSSISTLLPECYKPGKDPLIPGFFGSYNELEFMGEGGYWVAVVQVEASLDSPPDADYPTY